MAEVIQQFGEAVKHGAAVLTDDRARFLRYASPRLTLDWRHFIRRKGQVTKPPANSVAQTMTG